MQLHIMSRRSFCFGFQRQTCKRLDAIMVAVTFEKQLIRQPDNLLEAHRAMAARRVPIAEHHSCHHMVSGIHVGGAAGDVAREIADETHGDCADILDGDEPPHRRSRASLIN